MMGEVIRRRYVRLVNEQRPFPDLVLVDGGPTQLNAARAELNALGLSALPVAGLAKRHEEIYLPGCDQPIRLELDSPALNVLRRLRDEAHRFALTYHRHLRSQRIRESLLDDMPGIGAHRKKQLLEHFGSIAQLKTASVDAVASVPGFGPKRARDVVAFLRDLTTPAVARKGAG
jgi:excinuclease ABC subunit C